MNKVKFSDIANFTAGQSPKSEFYTSNPINSTPFLQGNRTFGHMYPEIDTYTTKITKLAKKGEVLMSVRAPVGDLNIAPIDVCIGRGLSGICSKTGDNMFLYYALKYNTPNLVKRSNGTTFEAINKDIVNQMEMIMPSDLLTQKKVSSLLSNIDLKIENNNKIISTLESLAKTIYDYWFLQFEFPNKDGKPYKSSGGKMVWNDELKREIPEGWKIKKIREIENKIVTGKTPATTNESNYGKDIPFVTIGDIRGNMFVTNTEQCLSVEGAESQNNKYLPKDSLCVSCIASPGLIAFTSAETSQTNQQINSIVVKHEYNKLFLYFALADYFKFSSGIKTGNTFKNMNKNDFESIKVIYPDTKVLISFMEKTESSRQNILRLAKESQELASLRDFLLPLLMNGQVTFKEES